MTVCIRRASAADSRAREVRGQEKARGAEVRLTEPATPCTPRNRPRAERGQTGWSSDLASAVKVFGPLSVMCQQSSSRTPNSPGT